MGLFKRNVEKSYKIVEISGNPKDVRKYLGVNKLCDLETIGYLCERFEKLFAIREVTTYDNLFGIRKSVESTLIPKFCKDSVNDTVYTLKSLGMDPYNMFYTMKPIDKRVNSYSFDRSWIINVYAFSTRDAAHKALDAYFSVIEKKKADEIAEKELNSRAFEIHSEDVLK